MRPPPHAYFIGLCGGRGKVVFLGSLLVGKDSFGEASRLRDRRLYLGVGAAGSKSPQQDPSLLAFVVTSVGFLFMPPPPFPNAFCGLDPGVPRAFFKNVQLSGIPRQLASPKQSSLIE